MEILGFLISYSILMWLVFIIFQCYTCWKYKMEKSKFDFDYWYRIKEYFILRILLVIFAPLGLFVIINLIILEYIKIKINKYFNIK